VPQSTTLGTLIRQHRLRLGLTQEELADRAGVSPRSISNLERDAGRTHYPHTMRRLADALQLHGAERNAFLADSQKAAPASPETADSPQTMRPAGILTFLVADLRGYSAYTNTCGDEAAATVAQTFAAIVCETVTVSGGELLELRGDEALAVFTSARGAIRAALALQDRLVPGTAIPLGAGIAVDAGEAVPMEGGYRGRALNRASRLCAEAEAGEILISDTVAGIAGKIEGLRFGERRVGPLKGFSAPVATFRVMRTEAPTEGLDYADVTVSARAVRLPPTTTPFIGRHLERAEITTLLNRDELKLLTLTGPGGTGKTRLAIETARDLASSYPEGIMFVDLSTVTDPGLVPAAIARAIGLEVDREWTASSLVESLGEGRRLIILDNFEQLIASVPMVAELSAGCPNLRIIVTSREILRVAAEQRFPVPPLRTPAPEEAMSIEEAGGYDAVTLFLHRARAVKPDFTLTAENAPAVAGICARLAGLPLAIELAAARVRLFAPDALLDRLERPLSLLTGGPRDAPARHQTLRATMAWSYSLLPPAEQTLFRRLAVFSGGFTLDAVEAISTATGDADRADVLDMLAALGDKSLVSRFDLAAGERFTMLPMIREYAAEELDASGERETIRRRHAEWFTSWIERGLDAIWTKDQPVWVRHVDEDHDNIVLALEWAYEYRDPEMGLRLVTGLQWPWICSLRLVTELRRWLHRFLELGGTVSPRTRALALTAWDAKYSPLPALARLEEAVSLARQADDPLTLLQALLALAGEALFRFEDTAAAAPALREAQALAGQLNDTRWIAAMLRAHSKAAELEGDDQRATDLLEQSLALERSAANPQGIAFCLHALAWKEFTAGDLQPAYRHATEGLSFYRQAGNRLGATDLSYVLVLISGALGDPTTGRRHAHERMREAEAAGDIWLVSEVCQDLGRIALREGELSEAETQLSRALDLARSQDNPHTEIDALMDLEDLALLTGDWQRASVLAQELGQAAGRMRHTVVSWGMTAPIMMRWRMDGLDTTVDELTSLATRAEQGGDFALTFAASADLARIDVVTGNPGMALNRLERTLASPRKFPLSPYTSEAQAMLLEAYIETGDLEKAKALVTSMTTNPSRPGGNVAAPEWHRILGKLRAAEGQWTEARAEFDQAITGSRGIFERALILLDLGRSLATNGDTEEARERLSEALSAFDDLRARPFAQAAEHALSRLPSL
jgi:non-specific serine/threonine protein kinase